MKTVKVMAWLYAAGMALIASAYALDECAEGNGCSMTSLLAGIVLVMCGSVVGTFGK